MELYKLAIGKGRALDEDDQRDGRRVVVVGEYVYTELFAGKSLADGLKVTFDGETFIVVGVLAHKATMQNGQSSWAWNNKVLLPEKTYDATWGKNHEIRTIYVRGPTSTEGHEGARATVMGTLLRRHLGVLNFKLKDDQSGGMEDLIMVVINVLLLSTGVLALVASGINIMNVMLVTVSERKREISLRCAIGATPAEHPGPIPARGSDADRDRRSPRRLGRRSRRVARRDLLTGFARTLEFRASGVVVRRRSGLSRSWSASSSGSRRHGGRGRSPGLTRCAANVACYAC